MPSELYLSDAIVIRAGIEGFTIARKLSESFHNNLLLKKEESFGRHVSRPNTEFIQSGIYYDQESLKVKICV